MNNKNCKTLLLLWRSRGLRNFHLRNYYRHLAVNNNNHAITPDHGWRSSTPIIIASNTNRHHRLALVRLLLTYQAAAHSQQKHFCTSATTTLNTIPNILSSEPDNTNIKLPDQIEQKCREWAQILRAECKNGKQQNCWMKKELKCRKVLPGLLKKTTKLQLSTKNLTPEQLRTLRNFFPAGQNIEMKEHQPQQLLSKNLRGIIYKFYKNFMLISVNQHFNIELGEGLKHCYFDIRKTVDPNLLKNELSFLAMRHSDWCKWPGYGTMLQAFKCQQLPEDTGVDPPIDLVGSHGKNLDPSQSAALSAALNMKRPIVAVHGPPGSGKTRILAEYLHALSQQGKKVLVLSSTHAGLYHLMGTFCKQFPSAASSNSNFLCLSHFVAQLASKVIADETLERLIKKRSFVNSISKTRKNVDKEGKILLCKQTRKLSRRLKLMIEETQDFSGEEFTKQQEAEELADEQFGLTVSSFDVVIIDDAVKLSEFDSWLMALPTAPYLRLFGDYNQQGIHVNSSIGRELNFDKSLLQRLDEEFGGEVNFHLRRQYRSNAAIQAWPNRAFYGQRAAEPDESVRNIRLDDLLEKSESSLPSELIMDPLVLVDLGQLEGHEPMFKAKAGGKSWQNWGEAFLAASHLWHLFEHIPRLCPSKIAYLTHHDAQRILISKMFSTLFEHHLEKLAQISMERSANLQGQQFDVVIQDCVTAPPSDVFINPFYLKCLSNEMCRARRQFIWFSNSKWLEEGSEQSRQLLQTFRQHGRIIGPDQLLPPAESSEFWKMPPMEMEEEENCHQQEKKLMNKRKRRGGIREFLSFFRS